jgi:hypothetical protein
MFVWCHESAEEFDPGLPRHHSLLLPARGEHARENLCDKETPPRGDQSIPWAEVCDASGV